MENNGVQEKNEVGYTPTYASAFAGIGGMSLGLKPLGYKGVIAWEYDPTSKTKQHAQEAHRLLHPEIPVEGDVYEADTSQIPDFDVFCFTPPCQAFSLAGSRKGTNFICTECSEVFVPEDLNYADLTTECPTCKSLAVPEDDRGVLTYQVIRIAKDKKPKALFMENVKGLLSHDKGNTLYSILKAFNEIGYVLDFTIMNSKFFDVAQRRERVYMIGLRKDLVEAETWTNMKGSTLLPKMKRYYTEKGIESFNFDWPPQEEVRTCLRDFLEEQVDERYYLTDKHVNRLISKLNEKDTEVFQNPTTDRMVQLNGDRNSPGLSTNEQMAFCIPANPMSDRVQCLQEVSATGVTTPNETDNTEEVQVNNKRLLNFFIKNSFKQEQSGNGFRFSPHVKENAAIAKTLTTRQGGRMEDNFIIEGINTDKPLFTFDSKNNEIHKVGLQPNGEPIAGVKVPYRIRKLTSTECLRLQAVPEDAIKLLQEYFSENRLYKFAGNGLTTSVVSALGERLLPYITPK